MRNLGRHFRLALRQRSGDSWAYAGGAHGKHGFTVFAFMPLPGLGVDVVLHHAMAIDTYYRAGHNRCDEG